MRVFQDTRFAYESVFVLPPVWFYRDDTNKYKAGRETHAEAGTQLLPCTSSGFLLQMKLRSQPVVNRDWCINGHEGKA